jgi:hypothetical protein
VLDGGCLTHEFLRQTPAVDDQLDGIDWDDASRSHFEALCMNLKSNLHLLLRF